MGNILNDIVDEVNIKPNKSKLIIKWVISIAGSLIVIAFAFGQFKSSFFNRMDNLEKKVDNNNIAIEQVSNDMKVGFSTVDVKIDKVYSDGLIIFNDFQLYNNKQLELMVDYSGSNKDMLKRMLEIGAMKQQQNVETQIESAKKEPVITEKSGYSIGVKKIESEKKNNDYLSLVRMIEVETGDTIFTLRGATKEFINKINKNRYEVGAIIQNDNYPNLFDVNYRNK